MLSNTAWCQFLSNTKTESARYAKTLPSKHYKFVGIMATVLSGGMVSMYLIQDREAYAGTRVADGRRMGAVYSLHTKQEEVRRAVW